MKHLTTVEAIKSEFIDLKNAPIFQGTYIDGTMSITAGIHGPAQTKLSINLSDYGMRPPVGHIFTPNYGVFEGLPDALEAAGIATKVDEVRIGFGSGYLMKLNDDLVAAIAA